MNKILPFCLLFIFLGVLSSGSLATAEKVRRSVYLDPFFGGKESGPVIDQISAKVFTLDTVQKLKASLEAKGIVTYLSRDSDSSIPLEERVTEGRLKRSTIYIAINMSKEKKECMYIYYPKQNRATTQNEEGVDAILENMKKKYIVEGSIKLAEMIMKNTKQISVPECIDDQSQKDYILNKAYCPTVIIDFGVSNSSSSYILNSDTMNKIIDSISLAIKEYLDSTPQ